MLCTLVLLAHQLSEFNTLYTATPPIAFVSEHYGNRKIPLILGQIALIGAQIMLMEAPAYWLMVLARIIQGISSAVIWTVGLALMYI